MHNIKKILHVLPIGSGHFGGIESYLMQYYQIIDHSKIHFDFAFCEKSTMTLVANDPVFSDSHFFEIGALKSLNNGLNEWKMLISKLRTIVINGNYDIVEVHTSSPLTQIACALSLNSLGVIKISHSHSIVSNRDGFIRHLFDDICKVVIVKKFDYYFACSKIAGESLFGKRIALNSNFYVIKNAIDIQKFRSNLITRNNFRISNECRSSDIIIGNIARLSNQKNQLFLLDIFLELLKLNDNYKLWFIGEGPMRQSIEKKVSNYHLTNKVKLWGQRDDIPQMLQAIDLAIIPSIDEGLCISAIESQASGIPTIVSSGIPEQCHITDKFVKINLNKTAQQWARIIVGVPIHREDTQNELIKAGYDIYDAANVLSNLYSRI